MADNYVQPRNPGNQRFVKDERRAQRDAEAARLRAAGRTYQQIADELGYCDRGEAWRGVQRCARVVRQDAGEQLITVEAAELDQLYTEALAVLQRDHIHVSNGRVVRHENGDPVLDDGPKLAAIDRLVKVRESYRRLFGLDQPARQEISGGVKYEVVGISAEDLT